jgi:hypothetical protein
MINVKKRDLVPQLLTRNDFFKLLMLAPGLMKPVIDIDFLLYLYV